MAKSKKKKSENLEQYQRVPISLKDAPMMSNVFWGDGCWKVVYAKENEVAAGFVKLWRLKQVGGDETVEVPANETVQIQKMYLDN